MMKVIVLFAGLILLVSCKGGSGDSSGEKIAMIKSQLEQISADDGFSGAVLVAQDDAVLFEKAYGYANLAHGVPNKLDTKFGIASMGKMFTAVAIMQLKEQGDLHLTDKVGDILPNYPNATVRDSVTVSQLLEHTSGLTDFFNDKFEHRAKHTVRVLSDYFEFFKDDSLLFSPGTQFSYSNAGYIVLGMIIEELAGMNYHDYVQRHVFLPAGMQNTDCYETDASIKDLAEGYIKKDEHGVWRTSTYMKGARGSSAGGAYSTLHDLFNFSRALKEHVLISSESLDLMVSDENRNGYGCGFSLDTFNDITVYGHNGGAHGVSAELDIYRDPNFVVVTLSNRGALDGWVDVRSMIRKELAGSTDETDKYLGSKALLVIYEADGYEAALGKLKTMGGVVSEKYLMNAANKYRDAKQFEKAIELLRILVVSIPDSWYCYSILADTYLEAGYKVLAIENYQESLKLEPKNEWAIEKLKLLEER